MYADTLDVNDRDILGVAFETTGGFGPGCQAAMRTCALRYEQSDAVVPFARYGDTWTTVSFSDYWSQRLAVQLRRGNDHIASRLLQAAKSACHRAVPVSSERAAA